MSPSVLLTDLPAFCTAHGIAWAEIRDAMRIGTITGFKATDGLWYVPLGELTAWWDKRELQRKWLQ